MMNMDTKTATTFPLSSLEETKRREVVLHQLVDLRNMLSLQQPFVHVVRLGLSLVHPIPAMTAHLLQENEYATVTMNDTDQILADLAEIL